MSPAKDGFAPAYCAVAQTGQAFGERADCAVKAVALACGVPYERVRTFMLAAGRKPGRRTRIDVTEAAVRAFGFELEEVKAGSFIERYPHPHHKLYNVTTHHPKRFNKVWADGATYLFRTRDHILAVVNGENQDWTRGRAKHVRVIYRVVLAFRPPLPRYLTLTSHNGITGEPYD